MLSVQNSTRISEQLFRIGCLEWRKLEDTEVGEAGGVNVALHFLP